MTTTTEPRTWAMPEIPADVERLTAVDGDLLATRVHGWPGLWSLRSLASGHLLCEIRTAELLARYSPLTEAPWATP